MNAKAQATPPLFYRTTEVARILRMQPSTVVELIRSGQIVAVDKSVKPGSRPRYLISETSLNDYLKSKMTAPEPKRGRRKPKASGSSERYF